MFLDPQHSFQTRGLKYFFFKPSRASAHLLTVTTPWETAAFALIELLPVTALTQNLCGEFKKTEKGRSGSPRFAFFLLRDSSQQQPLIQDLNSFFLCNDLKKSWNQCFCFVFFRRLLPPSNRWTPFAAFTASVLWKFSSPGERHPPAELWDLL